jgi:hypothetical protein
MVTGTHLSHGAVGYIKEEKNDIGKSRYKWEKCAYFTSGVQKAVIW